MNISLEQAETVVEAAKEKAGQLNTQMNISIVDAGVNLVAFARMDDAWIGSIDLALRGEIGKLSQPGARLGKSSTLMVDWSLSQVECLLKIAKGEIIGAIGVSGSSVENDHAVAQVGAYAMKQ